MTRICVIPKCDGEIAEGSQLDTCSNCRASIGMWKRRGARAVLERRNRLEKYDSRMQTILEPKAVRTEAKRKRS